jgi:hypothetical protein
VLARAQAMLELQKMQRLTICAVVVLR